MLAVYAFLSFSLGEESFGNTLSRESVICSQADLAGQPVFNESPSTENNSCARMGYFGDSALGYTML